MYFIGRAYLLHFNITGARYTNRCKFLRFGVVYFLGATCNMLGQIAWESIVSWPMDFVSTSTYKRKKSVN
jgi:hypothetical protein